MDRARFDKAAAAWPDVDVAPAELAAYLERCGVDPAEVADDGLAELYLACACGRGDAAALARFDASYLGAVPAALAHMRLPADTVDEVRQVVRYRLLVAEPGGQPRLGGYAGRGKLRGLIAVIAVRAALDLLRRLEREAPAEAGNLAELPSPEYDPELAYMKRRYRAAFQGAFERAVGELSSRDRNLLRLHLFGDLTVEQVGAIYGVHRATATRWLARVRRTLFSRTRRHMRSELAIDADEFESLMHLIESRLDASIRRMLDTRGDPPGE